MVMLMLKAIKQILVVEHKMKLTFYFLYNDRVL